MAVKMIDKLETVSEKVALKSRFEWWSSGGVFDAYRSRQTGRYKKNDLSTNIIVFTRWVSEVRVSDAEHKFSGRSVGLYIWEWLTDVGYMIIYLSSSSVLFLGLNDTPWMTRV